MLFSALFVDPILDASQMLLLAFVLFVLFMRIALRVAVVDCMDELRETESFKTRPGSMSESSPLESYDIFSDFEVLYSLPSRCRYFVGKFTVAKQRQRGL